MKTPIVYGEPIYTTESYEVKIGAAKEEDLPQYVVINRATGVVEFTNEVLFLAKDWARYFTNKLAKFDVVEIDDINTEAMPVFGAH